MSGVTLATAVAVLPASYRMKFTNPLFQTVHVSIVTGEWLWNKSTLKSDDSV